MPVFLFNNAYMNVIRLIWFYSLLVNGEKAIDGEGVKIAAWKITTVLSVAICLT